MIPRCAQFPQGSVARSFRLCLCGAPLKIATTYYRGMRNTPIWRCSTCGMRMVSDITVCRSRDGYAIEYEDALKEFLAEPKNT